MTHHGQQHMPPAVETALLVTRIQMAMCRSQGSHGGRPASVADYMAHFDLADNWQFVKANHDCVWLGDEPPPTDGATAPASNDQQG
jgi:hypothetical protein